MTSLMETVPCIVLGYLLQLVHKQGTTCQTLKESCPQTSTQRFSIVLSLSLSFSLSLENTEKKSSVHNYYCNPALPMARHPLSSQCIVVRIKVLRERICGVPSLVGYTMALWESLYRTTSDGVIYVNIIVFSLFTLTAETFAPTSKSC